MNMYVYTTTTADRLERYRSKGTDWRKKENRKKWKGVQRKKVVYLCKTGGEFSRGVPAFEVGSFEEVGDLLGYVSPREGRRGRAGDLSSDSKNLGWFTDIWSSGTVCGAVVELKTSKGRYYLPCFEVVWPGIGVVERAVFFSRAPDSVESKGVLQHVYDDNRDYAVNKAALAADALAEAWAERLREDSLEEEVAHRLSDYADDIHSINRQVLQALRELRKVEASVRLRGAVRSLVVYALQERKRHQAAIKKIKKDKYSVIPR